MRMASLHASSHKMQQSTSGANFNLPPAKMKKQEGETNLRRELRPEEEEQEVTK